MIEIKADRSYKQCTYCTALATHDVSRIKVCDHHIRRAVNVLRVYEREANGEEE